MSTAAITTPTTAEPADAHAGADPLARSLGAGPPTETLELLAGVVRAAHDRAARRAPADGGEHSDPSGNGGAGPTH